MGYELVLYEQIGPVARIWHNRPQARNAESMQLLAELDDAMVRAARDESVRVVILGGKGDHFSAGHDLKEAQAKRSNFTAEQRYAYEEQYYFEYCMRIWDLPKPTIAQVQGACVAGAFMVANMCDLIVAAENAYFSDPVGHTLACAAVEVLVHPWFLPVRKAKEMLYTGERLTAQDALAAGMVNRVVPVERLEEETMALANRIAQAPPFGLKLIKKSINRALDIQGMRTSLAAHFDSHLLSHYTDEFRQVKEQGLAKGIQRNKAGEAAGG